MRAAVYHGKHDVRVEEVPVPTPGPRDLLLEVVAVGICGTDAHEVHAGPHMFPIDKAHPVSGHVGPMIMGHEIAGRVVARGAEVKEFAEGELVVTGAGVSCGSCVQCRRGRTSLCESYWTIGLQRHGGLAEYVTSPAEICFSADSYGLSEDLAGISQPMSIAVHAASRARLTNQDEVVILGAGGIGAFLVHASATITDTIGVVDLSSERLAIAEKNGATFTALLRDGFDVAAMKRKWGIRPTVIFEVSGTPQGLASAFEWLEPGGRLVLVGIQAGSRELDVRRLSLIEHEVIGTNGHVARDDFPRALEMLASGGAWSDIAPDVLPLDLVMADGLLPMIEKRAKRIKTLFDPRIDEWRPSVMR